MNMFHKIKSVAALGGYVLLVHFADGSVKKYDFTPLFALYPVFLPLRDMPGLWELATVDVGGYGVSWNEDIDISCDELWANGVPASSPFSDLLAFSDATGLWGLSESTLRKAIAYHKLVVGVDVQKFGKQWVVTRSAMEREYGPLPLS